MKQLEDSKTGSRPKRGAKRRYAYAITRGIFLADSMRFTVMDQASRVLGGMDEATATFEKDPRETHPHLFVTGGPYGALFDLARGPDETYFARLETLASLANDPDHARRALNIEGRRE